MSATPFNALSDSEVERLAILSEECAEVIQIVGKILRHGYDSTHPNNKTGPCNREMLEEEIGHVSYACELMSEKLDISWLSVMKSKRTKADKIKRYLHHA